MKYSTPYEEKKMARAMGVSLPISAKKSVELCSFIRGKGLNKAMRLVQGVIDEKIAVPFRKYAKGGTGHKPGIGPGRYPVKVCEDVLKLLKQVQANARNKGLDSANLVISNILANKAGMAWHYGRQRRRRMKRTHIEVVVCEAAPEKREAARKAAEKPAPLPAPAKSESRKGEAK